MLEWMADNAVSGAILLACLRLLWTQGTTQAAILTKLEGFEARLNRLETRQ